MFEWRKKSVVCAGSVLFPGSIPPTVADMKPIERLGFTLSRAERDPSFHWSIQVSGQGIKSGTIVAFRDPPKLPPEMVAWASELTPEEGERALTGHASVTVRLEGDRGDVLRDRKTLLRVLSAIMGDDGVVAIDHTAERMWSRAALDDELIHDADLDIEALYTLHAVGGDDTRPAWLHTHGLAAIGLFDFDILAPHEDYARLQSDVPRAIATAISEGRLTLGGGPFEYAFGIPVRVVPVKQFEKKASAYYKKVREGAGDDHVDRRGVLCEPAGFFSRLLGGATPAKALQREPDPAVPLNLSNDANLLMAQRAAGSLPLFKKLAEEFRPLGLTPAVKLKYETDGGGEFDAEHMWFEAHAFDDQNRVDATLAVTPFNIAAMKPGDRGWHDLARLSDWLFVTPAGNITPRNTTAARLLRPHREEILAAIAKDAQSPEATDA